MKINNIQERNNFLKQNIKEFGSRIASLLNPLDFFGNHQSFLRYHKDKNSF